MQHYSPYVGGAAMADYSIVRQTANNTAAQFWAVMSRGEQSRDAWCNNPRVSMFPPGQQQRMTHARFARF
jgi:hypothetical protein